MYIIGIKTLYGWKRQTRQLHPTKKTAEAVVKLLHLRTTVEARVFDADHEPGRTLAVDGRLYNA